MTGGRARLLRYLGLAFAVTVLAVVIIAARPSMGKSALALCTAANLAVRHETPVALFTLEMSKSEVTQRLMCSEAKVESQRLRTGRLAPDDWPRLTAASAATVT